MLSQGIERVAVCGLEKDAEPHQFRVGTATRDAEGSRYGPWAESDFDVPGLVGLHRNQPVVLFPFGFPDPLSVAVVAMTGVAASVLTVGNDGVVNMRTVPYAMPTAFWAIAQT